MRYQSYSAEQFPGLAGLSVVLMWKVVSAIPLSSPSLHWGGWLCVLYVEKLLGSSLSPDQPGQAGTFAVPRNISLPLSRQMRLPLGLTYATGKWKCVSAEGCCASQGLAGGWLCAGKFPELVWLYNIRTSICGSSLPCSYNMFSLHSMEQC